MSFISKIKQGLLHMAAVVLVVTAVALPQSASAATSGNATIHNAVTVSYTSGANTLTAVATVDVTVTTLAAAPTITVPTATTTVAGGVLNLVYTVRSNANGSDTYTPTLPTTTDTGVSAPTITLTGSPLTLWGGIVLSSGVGTVSIPAGSETGITAGTTTVELLVGGAVQRYTVSTIAAGTIASTTAAGVTTAETNTVLTLAPIAAATPITAANVAVGTQVGEYSTFAVKLTAGTPTTPGTDGTHLVPSFNITTTATDAAGATIATPVGTTVTVTVSSPSLSITKKSRNVTAGVATFAATGVTARPNEVLEYEIVVTNTHATAQATGVSISDALPVYTTLQPATTITVTSTLGGVTATVNATQAAGDDVATVTAGTLTVNLGTGATSALTGTLAAGDTVTILYQVTVQ